MERSGQITHAGWGVGCKHVAGIALAPSPMGEKGHRRRGNFLLSKHFIQLFQIMKLSLLAIF
jgi:hypothetical protein